MPFLVGNHSCSGTTLARNTKVTKKKTKLFTVLSLSVLTCQQPDVFERINGMTQIIHGMKNHTGEGFCSNV